MSFGRVIETQFNTATEQLNIKELKVSFNILKTDQNEPNEAEITLYNLSRDTFNKISLPDTEVVLKAGYKDEGGAKVIFVGTITNPEYTHEGTETRTVLTCVDGQKDGRGNPVSLSYKKGTLVNAIVDDILNIIPMTSIKKAVIPNVDYTAGYSFVGRALDGLAEVLGKVHLGYTIQNNEIYILDNNQTINPVGLVFSYATGLLGKPELVATTSAIDGQPIVKKQLRIKTLLAPSVLPKNLIKLETKDSNGLFVVQNINHIGDNYDGSFKSEMMVIEE